MKKRSAKRSTAQMKAADIAVVLPAFNEQKYIGRVLKKLSRHIKNVVVIDDGSSDRTAKIALRFTPHVLVHLINLGKGASLKTGCEYAFRKLRAKAVIFMDSDDQHDTTQLRDFISHLKAGDELILGVRTINSTMTLPRFLGNKLTSLLIKALYGKYIPDVPSGYKAMTRKTYKRILWKAQRYEVESEMAVRIAKLRIPFTCIPISTIYHDIDKGMTAIDGFRMLARVALWRLQ